MSLLSLMASISWCRLLRHLIGTVEAADDIQKGLSCPSRKGLTMAVNSPSLISQVYAIECLYRDFIRVVYFHDALGGDDFHC